MPPSAVAAPVNPPRTHAEPRPVISPVSDSASEMPIDTPAPRAVAIPTTSAVWELLEIAAAKIGASVETVPSIRPTSDGWTTRSTNSLSSQPQRRAISRFVRGCRLGLVATSWIVGDRSASYGGCMRRVYGHVDMDAFYVSVELQSRPELAGKPVVVAGSGPRAVVTTASYEARKFGVFSATPAERARRLCPQAVFIPPDFEKYRARSREVMAVLREHVVRVEIVGLDEAYLDLTPIERPKAAARRLKADVRERTGLTCSIGIGPNKLVAKVASDADKPDGFVVLSREQACEH